MAEDTSKLEDSAFTKALYTKTISTLKIEVIKDDKQIKLYRTHLMKLYQILI